MGNVYELNRRGDLILGLLLLSMLCAYVSFIYASDEIFGIKEIVVMFVSALFSAMLFFSFFAINCIEIENGFILLSPLGFRLNIRDIKEIEIPDSEAVSRRYGEVRVLKMKMHNSRRDVEEFTRWCNGWFDCCKCYSRSSNRNISST